MFRRFLISMLCLCFLTLSAPCALAEPQPWLQPWVSLLNEPVHTQGELKLRMEAKAWENVLNAALSTPYSEETFLGMAEEDVEELVMQYNIMMAAQKKSMLSTIGGLSALLDEMSMQYSAEETGFHFVLLLRQQPVAHFSLIMQDQAPLLLSDLFPSYALSLNNQSIEGILSDLSIYADVGLLQEEGDAEADKTNLAQLLSRLMGHDLLAEMVEMGRIELEALAENGHAVNQQGKITYTGREIEKNALLEKMNLEYPAGISAMEDFLDYVNATPEEADTEAPVEGLVFEVMNKQTEEITSDEKPFNHTYSIKGNTLRHINTRLLEHTTYSDEKDPVTGAITRKSSTAQWENREQIVVTPTSMEITHLSAPHTSEIISIDACDPNTIRIYFQSRGDELSLEGFTGTLSRTDAGQSFCTEITIADPAISMRFKGNWGNDILSRAALSIDVLQDDQWHAMLGAAIEEKDTPLLSPLSLEGRTVITPNRRGEFDDAGYRKELQTVAKPHLNALVLTQLPKDARPLLTTLLGIIGQLGL